MKLTWVTLAALLLAVGVAEAGQGEICYSSSMPYNQAKVLNNDTKFTCPSLGEVTIPGIYQLGWRVSDLAQVTTNNDSANPTVAYRVLIEML